MNRDKLAFAYWQAVEDLTQVQEAIDKVREEVRADLNTIEALPVEERAPRAMEHLKLLQDARTLTATRLEVCNLRALLRTRANECAPDLIGRMASAVTSAFKIREGCAPCGESQG